MNQKCDICGEEIPTIYSRKSEFKKCHYELCSKCDINFFELKHKKTMRNNTLNDTLTWGKKVLQENTVNPEKRDNFQLLCDEAEQYITENGQSNGNTSNYNWQAIDDPDENIGGFSGFITALSPLLITLTYSAAGFFAGLWLGASLSGVFDSKLLNMMIGGFFCGNSGLILASIQNGITALSAQQSRIQKKQNEILGKLKMLQNNSDNSDK